MFFVPMLILLEGLVKFVILGYSLFTLFFFLAYGDSCKYIKGFSYNGVDVEKLTIT